MTCFKFHIIYNLESYFSTSILKMYLHKQAHFTAVITHFYFSIIKKRKPKTEGVGKRKM